MGNTPPRRPNVPWGKYIFFMFLEIVHPCSDTVVFLGVLATDYFGKFYCVLSGAVLLASKRDLRLKKKQKQIDETQKAPIVQNARLTT